MGNFPTNLSDSRFQMLSDDYEQEQEELREKLLNVAVFFFSVSKDDLGTVSFQMQLPALMEGSNQCL